jgi:hypothetical protein
MVTGLCVLTDPIANLQESKQTAAADLVQNEKFDLCG